jgi:hypothetical protein
MNILVVILLVIAALIFAAATYAEKFGRIGLIPLALAVFTVAYLLSQLGHSTP